jgi:hypothetical protein
VLVLSHGQVLEAGHPHELLTQGSATGGDAPSAFARMVDEASPEVSRAVVWHLQGACGRWHVLM